jgi:AhpD family alkylhydroperoxidase
MTKTSAPSSAAQPHGDPRLHVRFENARFDPDLTPFHEIAKESSARFGYRAASSLNPRLTELLRLRVAQLNPCPYCLILHAHVADQLGIPAEVVAHLPGWRESAMFSPTEKVALAYCEALTTYDIARFADVHDALRAHFDEKEVAEIAAVIINMNIWTRLKLAQGATPVETTRSDTDPSE